MDKNIENTFTPEYVLEYYSSTYGNTYQTKTDIKTVQKFMTLYGKMYPNDIDATCDLLRDYVLSLKGLF